MKLFAGSGSRRVPRPQEVNVPSASKRPPLPNSRDAFNSTNEIHPLVSPAYEDVPMWNILPSYQLYQSTISKNIRPNEDEPRFDPPTYERSSPESPQALGSNEYFPTVATTSSPTSGQGMEPSTRWENSILGNTHKLKKLVDVNTHLSEQLKIDINITSSPCQKGVRPKIIDQSLMEFHQGDSIHGFVTVTNKASHPIPFEMFSVVFEGKVSVMGDASDHKKPLVFYKFLNMFDFQASWTPAALDDEDLNGLVDPIDGTKLRFTMEKSFEPNITYKKFFTFKLPEKLLDCACEVHNLPRHCEILPTIGLARDQFMKDLRRFRGKVNERNTPSTPFSLGKGEIYSASTPRRPGAPKREKTRIKDLSFSDTAISYSVEVRVVGNSSDYSDSLKGHVTPDTEEFIIVNESSCFIRVIPKERLALEFTELTLEKELKVIYRNLQKRISQKIQLGKELLHENQELPLLVKPSVLNNTLSLVKEKQLYREPRGQNFNGMIQENQNENNVIYYPFKKKYLTVSKHVGTVAISTPQTEYPVRYIPPSTYKDARAFVPIRKLSTEMKVPITLSLQFGDSTALKGLKPPELRSVSAELVAVTYRSRKYPIPIEITNDLLFQNRLGENDNLDGYLIDPFKASLAELTSLTNKLGYEVLNVDSQLIMDMKCLSNLAAKYNTLKVDDVKTNTKNLVDWNQISDSNYTKELEVTVDLKKLFTLEGSVLGDEASNESYALIPNFQSCIIGRAYYLKVLVKLQNNDSLSIKVPVSIQI